MLPAVPHPPPFSACSESRQRMQSHGGTGHSLGSQHNAQGMRAIFSLQVLLKDAVLTLDCLVMLNLRCIVQL